MISKQILFEDNEILVCHKKAGVPVQSANTRTKDMVSLLRNYLALQGERTDIHVVHRLDQPVEGVLVFAKTKKAAAGLTRQITEGSMKKTYLAVCKRSDESLALPETGEEVLLTDYLQKDGKTNMSRVVPKGSKDAKKAELIYKIRQISKETGHILAEIDLHTGRHHQIRVQMAHAGLGLVGDRKYGDPDGTDGLGLCSAALAFVHPATGKKMKFETTPQAAVFDEFGGC